MKFTIRYKLLVKTGNAIRKYAVIVVFAWLALAAVSCKDYFEKAPGVDITEDTLFTSVDRATLFLLSLYNKVPDGYFYSWTDAETQRISGTMLAACTDQAESGWASAGSHQYNTGAITQYSGENLMETKWQIRWPYVYRSLWFIENVDRIKNGTDNQKSMLKAEARFLLAMNYFEFFIRYGGVPWLSKKLDYHTNDYALVPRMPLRQMVDSIDHLLVQTLAEPGLPLSRPEQEFGRVTKAAVLFLRARLWLFAARPLFNTETPYMNMANPEDNKLICMGNNDPARWQKAADAAAELIDFCEQTGVHELLVDPSNPSLAYQRATRDAVNNKELIFVPSRRGWSIKSLFPTFESPLVVSMGVADGNAVLPTQNLVDRYLLKTTGKAQNDPASGFDPADPYKDLDPRFYATIAENGSKWNTRTVELWNNRSGGSTVGVDFGFHRRDLSISKTGYLLRKFCQENLTNGSGGSTAIWPYMRLADGYLMYAEALNEVSGPGAECFKALNKVRARAGMPEVTSAASKDEMREIIIRERDVELALEDIHYFDVKHLKRGEKFGEPIYGIDIRKKEDGSFTYTKEKIEDRFWNDSWYLHPFPYFEMIRSKALVQNPGW